MSAFPFDISFPRAFFLWTSLSLGISCPWHLFLLTSLALRISYSWHLFLLTSLSLGISFSWHLLFMSALTSQRRAKPPDAANRTQQVELPRPDLDAKAQKECVLFLTNKRNMHLPKSLKAVWPNKSIDAAVRLHGAELQNTNTPNSNGGPTCLKSF